MIASEQGIKGDSKDKIWSLGRELTGAETRKMVQMRRSQKLALGSQNRCLINQDGVHKLAIETYRQSTQGSVGSKVKPQVSFRAFVWRPAAMNSTEPDCVHLRKI